LGWGVFVGDVELGDLDRQAEVRDIGEKPSQQRRRKGWPASRSQMGLDAHRVDWRPGSPHSFEQAQQRNTARFLFRRVELDIVFVDDEAGIGIGVPRGVVGEIEIFGPERLEKYRGTQTVRPPILGFDRLVDDIPTMDPAAITSGQLLDVVDDGPFLLPSIGQVEIPTRGAVVPEQIVPAEHEPVGRREVGDRVSGSEVVIPRAASVHDLPLHLVLGDDETGFLTHKIEKWAVSGDLPCGDCRPVDEPFFGCQFAERDRLRRQAARGPQVGRARAQQRKSGGKKAPPIQNGCNPGQLVPHRISSGLPCPQATPG
jgi:hypothetical protein